jgi:hypothetical protein
MKQRYKQPSSGDGSSTGLMNNKRLDELDAQLGPEGDAEGQRASSVVASMMHSVFWVGLAYFTAVESDFWRVVHEDSRVHTGYLWVGLACIALEVVVLLYLMLWIPCVEKVAYDVDYNTYCPRAIYTALFGGFLGWLAFTLAVWGVYGYMTPLMISVFSFALILLPNFLICKCS